MLSQLLLELHHIHPQRRILIFEAFGVAAAVRAASNAIGSLAFRVVLEAWRASARTSIAPDLADLELRSGLTSLPRVKRWTHFTTIASLAGAPSTIALLLRATAYDILVSLRVWLNIL